jgi:flavin-binding protein dodecin
MRQYEDAMKRAKTAKPAAARSVAPRSGRDAVIDHLAQLQGPDPSQAPAVDHIYRVIELVGSSEESIEDAIDAAVARAHRTLRNLRWFEVVRTSGHIEDGKVRHFQVTIKVGFTMDEKR